MLTVRPISPTDSLDQLTGLLHRAYASLGEMGLNYTAVDQSREVTEKRIHSGQCYVAEWSGKIAGTIVVQPTNSKSACTYFHSPEIASAHQFGVEPSLHGRGIGRALLSSCEAWARERNYRKLAIDTAEQADHLIRLYAKFGYVPVGFVQWPGKVYRSVVMSKVLQQK